MNITIFWKNNKTVIIIFMVLMAWLLSIMISRINNNNILKNNFYDMKERCIENSNISESCNYYIENEYKNPSVYVEFSQVMVGESLNSLQLLAPLIIIVASTSKIHSKMKTGFFKNELLRTDYSNWFKKTLKSSLSVIWILPVFVICVFLLCLIETKNLSFPEMPNCISKIIDGKESLICSGEGNMFLYGSRWIPILSTFSIVFIINIILNSIFYVNLALISCKKNKNIMVSIIVAFLMYIVLNIILEVFIGGLLFAKTLNIHNISAFIGLGEYWCYENQFNIWFLVLYYLFWVLVSYIVLRIVYMNKEKVIIENEK